MNGNYPFDRPVIILGAPRSGTTLLFETLSLSDDVWTIGGESHGMFESINRFNPLMGYCDSNAIAAEDATPSIVRQIRVSFLKHLRDAGGREYSRVGNTLSSPPRLLEKTPKNALRISLLNRIFPDALFIYLYRNPRENVSSMMDAWDSGRFVTYPSLPGRDGPWSLLLPPGWQSYNNARPEQIAAFQWQEANMTILKDLQNLERQRWMAVSYGQQVQHAADTVRRICEFCDISSDRALGALSSGPQPLSRYTLTPPSNDKWHRNAAALSRVLPDLGNTVDYIRKNAEGLPDGEFDISIDPSLLDKSAQYRGDSIADDKPTPVAGE
jgi:hypothetical protein